MKSQTKELWCQTHDREEIQARQLRKLRHFLKHRVMPFSDFYRRNFAETGITPHDIRSWHDLSLLPFTEKSDLLPNPRDFVLIPRPSDLRKQPSTIWRALVHGKRRVAADFEREFRPLLMTSTTGRSSQPLPFLYTAHDLDNLTIAGRRIMEVGGTQVDWRHANLFPFAPHLAFWQAHYASLGFGAFMVGTGGGKTLGTAGNISLIDKVKPEVLIAVPTFLYHLLSQAVSEGHHWPHLQKLVLGGEKVPNGMRRKLRALCAELGAGRVDVVATYAFTEAKMAWIECPTPPGDEPSGYHLYPDLGIIEVIDPDSGKPVAPGQPGEIVFTSLDSRGTVVIRYRTGDRVDGGLTWDACQYCGRRCPRLVGNISRVSEFRRVDVAKLKGTLVDFNALEHALDDVEGIGAWQIELRKHNDDPFESDEIVIHAATERSGRHHDLEQTVARRFLEVTELRPNRFEWHSREELSDRQGVGRALKEEKIVDHRPVPEAVPRRPESSAMAGKTKQAEKFFADEASPALLI
ncbi:MAG: phenylacetate--CoA ligase family protein [Verrucomicrobiales bacterium]